MSEPVTEVPLIGMVLRPPKTVELIASYLRRQIVRGELKAGETLPLASHLREQFGVSRRTLREAVPDPGSGVPLSVGCSPLSAAASSAMNPGFRCPGMPAAMAGSS